MKLDKKHADSDTDVREITTGDVDNLADALKTIFGHKPTEPYRADNNPPPVAKQNLKWRMVPRGKSDDNS